MAAAAPDHGARIEFVSATPLRNPFSAARGLVLLDSIAAWSVAPWLWRRPQPGPIAAILHQPPGGVDHGPARTALQRPLDRALYRRCALLIAASATLRDELVADHALPIGRIEVVPPGCDLPVPSSPPDDLRCGRRIAAVTVASWLPNKGILELLDAVACLPPDALTLHLAGRDDVDPAYSRRVWQRLAAADLGDRVVAHGTLPPERLARLYQGADAFALLSRHEAYGTVYGEALRAGLPIVGWHAGNLPNLVADGREGCVLPVGDVAGVRAALARMATDGAWRERLSAASRQRGERLPTWSDTAAAFFAALRRVAPGGPG